MATIGDKKVSLALQDGSSINLNKPKILPDTITKFADITEIGWYEGTITPSGEFPNRTCQISDCPDILPSYPYGFTLFVFDSRFNKNGGMSYVYFGYDSVYIGTGFLDDNADFFIKWRLLSSKEEVLKDLVVDDLTSTSSNKALSANQGKVLKDLIGSNALPKELEDAQDISGIDNCGWYRGKPKIFTANTANQTVEMDQSYINAPILNAIVYSDGYTNPNDGPDVYVDLFVLGTDYIMYIPSIACEQFSYDGDAVYYGNKDSSGYIHWHIGAVSICDDGIRDIAIADDKSDYSTKVPSLNVVDSLIAMVNSKASTSAIPKLKYSKTDLTAGSSTLETGTYYFVYE